MEQKKVEYEAKLDSRKRLTLRETPYEHYHVTMYEDGRVLLEPRVLIDPAISARTLRMIDEAMSNLEKGIVSEPVDPELLRKMAEE